jgi:hypothetical protein
VVFARFQKSIDRNRLANSTTARVDSTNYTSLLPASFREFAGIGRAAQLAIAPEFRSTNILANSAASHPSGGCQGRDTEMSKKLVPRIERPFPRRKTARLLARINPNGDDK